MNCEQAIRSNPVLGTFYELPRILVCCVVYPKYYYLLKMVCETIQRSQLPFSTFL